jgi:hypothetical protein
VLLACYWGGSCPSPAEPTTLELSDAAVILGHQLPDRVRPARVADGIAELQAGWPTVPIIFADTRELAQEWTYRFLATAAMHTRTDTHAAALNGDHPEPAPAAGNHRRPSCTSQSHCSYGPMSARRRWR